MKVAPLKKIEMYEVTLAVLLNLHEMIFLQYLQFLQNVWNSTAEIISFHNTQLLLVIICANKYDSTRLVWTAVATSSAWLLEGRPSEQSTDLLGQ